MNGGSNGRVVVSRDTNVAAVVVAAAATVGGGVKLMTSALLPENRVIGEELTELAPFAVLFPVVVDCRSANVIVVQLEVA